MENKYKCEVCEKISEYEGLVAYLDFDFHLCKSHYLKWCRHHSPYQKEHHKNTEPCTKEWKKMCREEERLVIKWMKEQKNLIKQKN